MATEAAYENVELLVFREAIRAASPLWLATGYNEKILYSAHALLDATGAATQQGILCRFPGVALDESLPYIGKERRIRRGLYEDNPTYADRLRYWLRDHRFRGGPYALLNQLYLHYKPHGFPIDLIYASGKRYSITATNPTPVESMIVWSQTGSLKWAQWTLIYYTDQFSGALTPDQIADLASIPREWNAAHAIGTIIVLPTGGELWDSPPPAAWDTPLPSTWSAALGPSQIITI